MTKASSVSPSSLNQGPSSSDTDQEHPKLGRFERIKKGIVSTVRAHPYLMVTVITSLALIAIFRRFDVAAWIEKEWSTGQVIDEPLYTCGSCSSIQPFSHRPSSMKKGDALYLCQKCDQKAFEAATRKLLPPGF
jgi:hypothetical protein